MSELRWESASYTHGKVIIADRSDFPGRYAIKRPQAYARTFILKYNGEVIYESGSVDLCKAYALKHCNSEAK